MQEVRGGKSQKDFALELGVSLRSYANYEADVRIPPGKVLERIARIGHTTADWILTGLGMEKVPYEYTKFVPLLSLVGAGTPKELFDREPIGFVAVPSWDFKPSLTALKISGESMEPSLKDGAEIIVDRNISEIIDGKVYVIYIRDNGIVIKRLYRAPGAVILRSDNPASPEIICKPDEIEIQGKILKVSQEV